MAITLSKFVNASVGTFLQASLDPKRQRILRILAKAAYLHDALNPAQDYYSTAAKAKQLVTDSALVTTGMTPDQVRAATIYVWGPGSPSSTTWPTTILSSVAPLTPLDDNTLDRMELVLDYYLSGGT